MNGQNHRGQDQYFTEQWTVFMLNILNYLRLQYK